MNAAIRGETARHYASLGRPGTRRGTVTDPISGKLRDAVMRSNGSIEYTACGRNRNADTRTAATWSPV